MICSTLIVLSLVYVTVLTWFMVKACSDVITALNLVDTKLDKTDELRRYMEEVDEMRRNMDEMDEKVESVRRMASDMHFRGYGPGHDGTAAASVSLKSKPHRVYHDNGVMMHRSLS